MHACSDSDSRRQVKREVGETESIHHHVMLEQNGARVFAIIMANAHIVLRYRAYFAGQKNIIKGCVIKTATLATSDSVSLASRVDGSSNVNQRNVI